MDFIVNLKERITNLDIYMSQLSIFLTYIKIQNAIQGAKMETKELLKSPQFIIVYAMTLLYTITFSLAGVIDPAAKISSGTISQEVIKKEAITRNNPEVTRNNSSG
ncbi:hypothetical protein [Nitrosomonas ureae]|uniref:Uncharacterized protein n=1 Tax=Nitrosomonas ureae TaxID=44577 RepID=A0A1H9GMW1_9PROT|nr:hypothetical protein [Nitrosomonas ureae]SEQ51288.1 hypothetical protein SAMN05421510_10695 [Nitrosomonas ureae]